VKVYVWKDEAYPVYGIDTDEKSYRPKVEIPDELYARYIAVEKEYGKVQDELEKYSCE